MFHANKVNLSDFNFWRPLLDHINNPCITEFIIEQAVLSRISFHGLNIAGKGIDTPMSVVSFSDSFPNFRTDIIRQPVLYCPQEFNYPGIDAIIVWIGPKPITKSTRPKLFMYPLQITLTPDRHSVCSGSHRTFFNNYKSWTEHLEEKFDVVPTFLWISPKVASPNQHNPTNEDNWPAHYVPISQAHSEIWEYYVRLKRKQQTQGAPETPAGGDERREMEKQGIWSMIL